MLYNALQSCTGSVQGQNRVFPVKFSTQGKTCFHYREPLLSSQGPLFSLQGFPCEKTSRGKPCFHYSELVCSVEYSRLRNKPRTYAYLVCQLFHALNLFWSLEYEVSKKVPVRRLVLGIRGPLTFSTGSFLPLLTSRWP